LGGSQDRCTVRSTKSFETPISSRTLSDNSIFTVVRGRSRLVPLTPWPSTRLIVSPDVGLEQFLEHGVEPLGPEMATRVS
jgi:hypothetical protein